MAKTKNVVKSHVLEVPSNELLEMTSRTSYMRKFVGQNVAVIAARYQYRGILTWVGEDALALANATAVESSGATQNVKPEREDPIGSTIMISTDAIELFYQPQWVFFPLPGEEGWEA